MHMFKLHVHVNINTLFRTKKSLEFHLMHQSSRLREEKVTNCTV